MKSPNEVSKQALVVHTAKNRYKLLVANEKGEREIRRNGQPLLGSRFWVVTNLKVGEPMEYYPEGCFDPDDCLRTRTPVILILAGTV